ncbi:hypothetical protein BASA81_012078 [Batrachochytrium salamandrivorans]|nr:hypothetical protein BASA81_012078 [Batrachochytrium salamandrivorans]
MNNAERITTSTIRNCWQWSNHSSIGGISSKAVHPVTVLCDHKNLEYFMSTKKLTRRQARWSLELSEYTFTITHRPGKLNGRADSLQDERIISWTATRVTSRESLTRIMFWIFKLQWRISISMYWFTALSWIRTHAHCQLDPFPSCTPFERWGIDFYGPMVETKSGRTYWIMTPQGLRLPNAVNQADLAPWLAPVIDNVDFFYDGKSKLISGFVKTWFDQDIFLGGGLF